MQVVNVKSLESTLVSNTPIYYSRVETKYPQFGFTVRRASQSESQSLAPNAVIETSNNWNGGVRAPAI